MTRADTPYDGTSIGALDAYQFVNAALTTDPEAHLGADFESVGLKVPDCAPDKEDVAVARTVADVAESGG